MSKVLVLGGTGIIASSTVEDLVKTGDFEKITIAGRNVRKAEELAATLKDDRVSIAKVDANNVTDLVKLMKGYDVVVNGLPRDFGLSFIKAAIEARVNSIDMTSPNPEKLALDGEAKKADISCIGGCGMTPGVTNLLPMLGAERLDSIEQIDIDFAAFRPIALSPALLHGVLREFGLTNLRLIYENRKLIAKPPFSGAKIVNFPEPIGKQTTYFVPHGESVTLSKNVKGVKRVYIRGCFSPEIMGLLRAYNDFGIYTAEAIEFEGKKIVPFDFLKKYLLNAPEGHKSEILRFFVQIELTGRLDGRNVMLRLMPKSPEEWSEIEGYTRVIGYPLSIGAQLLAQGKAKKKGVDGAEVMLPAQEFFDELAKRGITISEELIEL